ncbi:hypothetical protein BO99DRAFT_407954 [Aspergillus violaceofuscus CBS 115571]|uniref:Secreted protein n=1 Tax=Aspergillus violaceofuscus (strain CBS 115571) TaxID=1450538 RepID=A0A2V5GUY8_ASPV1|nr:hypothetical protein BO99DRAFT_407954 [Aspergillus violaceofuscus CBS 115571]
MLLLMLLLMLLDRVLVVPFADLGRRRRGCSWICSNGGKVEDVPEAGQADAEVRVVVGALVVGCGGVVDEAVEGCGLDG